MSIERDMFKYQFILKIIGAIFCFLIAIFCILGMYLEDNNKEKEELEGQVYQLTLDYQIKVQEIVELKKTISTLEEENNNLKVYISSLEKFN